MCASWRTKGLDPDFIATELEKLRIPASPGRGSFSGDLFFDDLLSSLEDTLSFEQGLPGRERQRIVSQAVFDAAGAGEITRATLRREVSKREYAFLTAKPRRYVLVTGLSTNHFAGLRRTRLGEHTFTFDRYLPERFHKGHDRAIESVVESIPGELPRQTSISEHYTFVRVSTWGRSEDEASEKALEALDLLRGIWTLHLNRRQWSAPWHRLLRPPNQLLLAPVQALHRPSGRLIEDYVWYDPHYAGPAITRELQRRWGEVLDFERWVRRRLTVKPHRVALESAIRRYARALDGRDFDAVMIKLWSVLELLTASTDYDVVIKRALFVWSNEQREMHRHVLETLRRRRNQTVHAGRESKANLAPIFQLKRYVEELLLFHLRTRFGFTSIAKTAALLDLPTHNAQLLDDIGVHEDAIKLLRYAQYYHRPI